MSKPPAVSTALDHGIRFLAKAQEADGSFISFSSASMQPFRRLRSWQTVFVPALMLASLSDLESDEALSIRRRLADFLLKEQTPTGAFNYWSRSAPEHLSMPYPNDLDDTFCALAALHLHDSSLVDAGMLAKAIKLLLVTETSVGGPYRTWLVPPDSPQIWLDIDPAVNSNIAYFLSLVSHRLPKLDELMGQAILAESYVSPYYPSEYAFIYYFARSYDGPHRARLLQKARRMQATAATELDQALCLAARLRLGDKQDLAPIVRKLRQTQRRDGSWAAAAFYADPVKNGKLYFNGGAALTTAFVLEALQLYAHQKPIAAKPKTLARSTAVEAVLATAKQACQTLPADLRRTTIRSITKIARSSNASEITGLPQAFNQSLLEPLPEPRSEFLAQLSLANLYGWTAYTIYDDFLDEEGQPGLLPSANVALRGALNNFLTALPDNQTYRTIVTETFNTIDGANAWELAHCRYVPRDGKLVIGTLPDYGERTKLAERSLGHTLAPLAVLHAAGATSTAIRHTCQALAEYLIVRQLNDDLHDWQEDLEKGHITYVVARLLSDLNAKRGSHELAELVTAAQPQFWYETLPTICKEMRQHIAHGRQALHKAAIFKETGVISRLFDGLESSIEETLAKQSQAEKFLKQYRTV